MTYRRKQRFDITYGMFHQENPGIARLYSINEHAGRVEEVYTMREQLDKARFFASKAEGDSWEAKKMAEANKILTI